MTFRLVSSPVSDKQKRPPRDTRARAARRPSGSISILAGERVLDLYSDEGCQVSSAAGILILR